MPGVVLAMLLAAPASPANAAPVPQVASSPSVFEILAHADKVRALGAMAAESAELETLKAAIRRITLGYRAELGRARATGTPPHSCPPERSGLTSTDFITVLNTVPPEDRTTTPARDIYAALMKKRFPCGSPR